MNLSNNLQKDVINAIKSLPKDKAVMIEDILDVSHEVRRAQEKGYFQFGGSTVVRYGEK